MRSIFFDFRCFSFPLKISAALNIKKNRWTEPAQYDDELPVEMNECMNERKKRRFSFLFIPSQKREFAHSVTELDYGFVAGGANSEQWKRIRCVGNYLNLDRAAFWEENAPSKGKVIQFSLSIFTMIKVITGMIWEI